MAELAEEEETDTQSSQALDTQTAVEESEDQHYNSVDELKSHGISSTEIKKLTENGYYTVESVAYVPRKQLIEIRGMGEAKVAKVQEAAMKFLSSKMKFSTAAEVYEKRESLVRIATGSQNLNNLLGGGIEAGSITEIFGEFRTGKTQICHSLCVMCQFPPDSGGAAGCALYIDTEGTFRPERITAMCNHLGIHAEDALTNINYARAYSSDHQMKLLGEAQKMMTESRYGLVVVDSATALFRSEYIGRGELSMRQQMLGKFMRELLQMCEIFGVAVVITNQVVANPDGMSFAPTVKPIGGNIIAHASTTRIMLRKGSKNTRIAKIYDSPNLPESEETFAITEYGIDDPK